MKNVDEFYKKYCNAYKSKYDTDDELNEAKPKRFDHNQLNDCITKIVEMNLMKEQNWLTILELIQTMLRNVWAIKKFLMISKNW